jgi:hypothetical protein
MRSSTTANWLGVMLKLAAVLVPFLCGCREAAVDEGGFLGHCGSVRGGVEDIRFAKISSSC